MDNKYLDQSKMLMSREKPLSTLFNNPEGEIISQRTRWITNFVKNNIFYLFLLIIILIWGLTAFVQIEASESGILYHFGKLKKNPLTPGLHLKWPWPIDTVLKIPVKKISSFTVGFAGKHENYLWSSSQKTNEYKLLQGDGRELVTINMEVYYQIDNTTNYLLRYCNPEEKLEGEAYRILLQEIVNKNIDQLMSRDRKSLGNTISSQLQQVCRKYKLGLEVINIALTNIHPPVDLVEYYRELVNSQIQKKILIAQAEAAREKRLPLAEREKSDYINKAKTNSIENITEANSKIITFTYQNDAFQLSPLLYKKRMRLNKLIKVLSDKNLYLINSNLSQQNRELWFDLSRIPVMKGIDYNE